MQRRRGRSGGLEGNVLKFFLYRGLQYSYLWMPVWVIYLQRRRGLSLTEVMVVDAVFWLVAAASEVPTGVVADRYGRRVSLAIGVGMQAGALALYGLAPTLPLLMLASVLWAVSASFLSGAEQALLFDTLHALGRDETYPRVAGRSLAIMQASWALGGVAGSFLGAYDLSGPFVAASVIELLALGVILTMQEPPRRQDAHLQEMTYLQTIRAAGAAIWANAGLRSAVVFASLIPLPKFIVTIVFIQPQALALGVPIAAIGLLTLAVRGTGVAGSMAAGWIAQRVGERRWPMFASALVIGSLLLLAQLNSLVGLALFAIAGFVTSAVWPTAESLILRQAASGIRATVMSGQSLLFTLLLAAIEPGLGAVADRYGLAPAYAALGIGLSLALVPLFTFWRKVDMRPVLGVEQTVGIRSGSP